MPGMCVCIMYSVRVGGDSSVGHVSCGSSAALYSDRGSADVSSHRHHTSTPGQYQSSYCWSV